MNPSTVIVRRIFAGPNGRGDWAIANAANGVRDLWRLFEALFCRCAPRRTLEDPKLIDDALREMEYAKRAFRSRRPLARLIAEARSWHVHPRGDLGLGSETLVHLSQAVHPG